jgi:hypothetical protein
VASKSNDWKRGEGSEMEGWALTDRARFERLDLEVAMPAVPAPKTALAEAVALWSVALAGKDFEAWGLPEAGISLTRAKRAR